MGRDGTGKTGIRANVLPLGASEHVMTTAAGVMVDALQASVTAPASTSAHPHHAWVVRVIHREGAGILRMLWRLLGREADVMDAYQDCFCKLASRKTQGRVVSARAYAYRTAANIAIEMMRVRQRRQAHLPAIALEQGRRRTQEGDGEAEERFGRLREAIAQLPAHLRNVIILRDLNRYSYAQVGRILGIEPATARVYRRHAVVKLAELLDEGKASWPR